MKNNQYPINIKLKVNRNETKFGGFMRKHKVRIKTEAENGKTYNK